MREKLARFMYGRYGADRLSKHLVMLGLILSIASMFTNMNVMSGLAFALILYAYFRIFSRNHAKRYAEGRAYEQFWQKVRQLPNRFTKEVAQRKTHRIYRCPSCRQRIRVPKGRGNVEIRCQKCQTVFRKRT